VLIHLRELSRPSTTGAAYLPFNYIEYELVMSYDVPYHLPSSILRVSL
jgi:hypothetical protein